MKISAFFGDLETLEFLLYKIVSSFMPLPNAGGKDPACSKNLLL
jgi:hypothetical protein